MGDNVSAAVVLIAVLLLILLLVAAAWRLHRRRGRIGPGAIGALNEMLNEEKRRAVQILVEGRAEERRPEYPDGNLPDLEAANMERPAATGSTGD